VRRRLHFLWEPHQFIEPQSTTHSVIVYTHQAIVHRHTLVLRTFDNYDSGLLDTVMLEQLRQAKA